MADRRGVRPASRRITPAPQPQASAANLQDGRASHARRLRSASRDVEEFVQLPHPARRSQPAGVAGVVSESDNQGQPAHKTKPRPAKKAVDLTIVEELDTQIDLEDASGTPPRTQYENSVPYRSPGAASQMSGTTAMPSFSQVEDDSLDSDIIMKHLRKLGNAAEDFLDHIVPDNRGRDDDLRNLQELHNPNSGFLKEYQEFDKELNEYVKDFKSQEQDYVNVQGIHRALFDANGNAAAVHTGLDLILYMTNLVIFTKRMIHPDLNQKDTWDALRQLDMSFPSHFVPSFSSEENLKAGGESALLKKTFKLALEMRTQLAIMVLKRSLGDSDFDPNSVISEVFLHSKASQEPGHSSIRGWSGTAMGEDSALSLRFQHAVLKRMEVIGNYFPMDIGSLERGEKVLMEDLVAKFPWDGDEGVIVQLLDWTRLRYQELRTTIEKLGGAAAIVRNIKKARDNLQPTVGPTRETSVPRETSQKKRRSFGPDRRRSSRKFDPNAPVDMRTIDALKAREKASEVHVEADALPETRADPVTLQTVEESRDNKPVLEDEADEHDDWQTTLAEDELQIGKQLAKEVQEPVKEITASGPPEINEALVRSLKAVSQPEKENRAKPGFLDRQLNAQRVDFGDGFETQAASGPSNTAEGKQRVEPSSRKRGRSVDEEDDSDSDAFETEDRTARVKERRQKAYMAKKARPNPTSSAAPPSHKPPRQPPASSGALIRHQPAHRSVAENDESVSETEAPNMTEEAPPPSTYSAQHQLAKQNTVYGNTQRERKLRTSWTPDAEEAFVEYMAMFPQKYSLIQKHDASGDGYGLLEGRTQVNLKDKAVTMAINMIKSGTGVRPGFENVVGPTTKHGKALIEAGFTW